MRTALLLLPALLPACSGDGKDTDTTADPVDCSTRPTDIPTARGEIAGGYDDATGRFVFFGGDEGVPVNCSSQTSFVKDTWVWESDCGNFREVAASGPSARGRYAGAAGGGKFYVQGGRFRDGTSGDYTLRPDLWAFDFASETWAELNGDGPDRRNNHAGAVVAGGKLVIHGGTGSTNGLSYSPLFDDTWVYDPASDSWSEITGAGGPGRVFHALASDGQNRVWLFGGGDENAFSGPFFKDVWELDVSGGTWTRLHDGSGKAPDGRIWPNLAYDAAHDQLVMFAGHDDRALGNSNAVWTFDLATDKWTEKRGGDVVDAGANGFCDFPADFVAADFDSPERRYGAAMAITGDGRLVTFGGKTDCGIINDLWTYDIAGDAWTRVLRATDGESCIRAYDDCTALCF
ncbi:MAG: hypothetical protein H6738_15020 [Alphaproteobacteria bacterium]|nr:hypothetical protein [Alphaproteobacteria bacterium]